MLRVIHSQSEDGIIILSDIEDGVRFNSRHILDAAKRATMKQTVVVPFYNPDDSAQPGFVDLVESDNVLLSADHGVIKGLVDNGLATVQIYSPGDLSTPVITTANLGDPLVGELTVSGTGFLSIPPEVSKLVVTGTGAVTLTRAQVIAGSGTWTDTAIYVPAALIPGLAPVASSAMVTSDANDSNVEALGDLTTPVITTADLGTPGVGDLTVTGTDLLSVTPDVSSLVLTGTGAITLTRAEVLLASGTWTDTAVFVPAAAVPGIALTTTSAMVTAHTNDSNVEALT